MGTETARIVAALSNPLPGKEQLTKERKRRQYAEQVKAAIAGDAAVFIAKFTDYTDNASAIEPTVAH